MLKFLNTCAEIEETVGAIYRLLADALPEGHELRRIWLEMADDEVDHARQIRFAARLPAREVFQGVNIPLARIEELLQTARAWQRKLTGVRPSISEALALALQLETDFSLVHVELAVEFQEESMRRLFQALANDDGRHAGQLRQYLAKLPMPPAAGASA
jgi:rubrerythrin